jgi:hypothetical protein
MTKEIEFDLVVDKSTVKMGDLRKADKGDVDAQYNLLTAAMHDLSGNKITREDAVAILDELDTEQYKKVFKEYVGLLYDVPLA